MMGVYILSVFLLICYQNSSVSAQDPKIVTIYKFSCEDFNLNYLHNNYTCMLKPKTKYQNHTFSDVWLKKKVSALQVVIKTFKFKKEFRPYMLDFRVDWCATMSGGAQNFFIQLGLKTIDKTNFIHPCPIEEGHIFAYDVWWDTSKVIQPFPEGRYQLKISLYEKNTLLGHMSYFGDILKVSKKTLQTLAGSK